MAVSSLIPLPRRHGRLDTLQGQVGLRISDSARDSAMSISVVLVNASTPEEARRIGLTLVDSRLAASVNVLDGVHSIYRWAGAVRQRTEAQLLIKTRAELVDDVVARVCELHSYECPGVIVLPVERGYQPYLDWVLQETAKD